MQKKKHQITNQSKMLILKIKNKKARCLSTNLLDSICREGKFPTYHKLTRHTTKSTKYSQLQSATYYC